MTYHLEDQLSAYIDDELEDHERQQVEAHLESCETCQILLEDLLSIQNVVMSSYEQVQAPDNLEALILQSMGREQPSAIAKKGWFLISMLALLSLGILWFVTSTVLVNLLHGFLKLTIALVYLASHYLTGLPMLSGLMVVFSLVILILSAYSLKRLLQTTTP